MNARPDIFLSYNREDHVTARRFAEAFAAQGFEVWWDATLRSGEAYDEVTEKALREARAVVVLWSKKSVVSRWVRSEATIADRNKTLVPAMIEACERPIMFELTQTAELAHWTGSADDTAWVAFLADVKRFVDKDHALTPLQLVAKRSIVVPTRLHCLLADGVDHIAAAAALARQWELIAPLPFGRELNVAINALPASVTDARALLEGHTATDAATQARAEAVRSLSDAARRFELAEQDEVIAALFLSKLEAPTDIGKAQAFSARSSERVALAARVMIEQSDLLIGVWDGASQALVGGTGHTIAAALTVGAPVVWIDVNSPETWRILRAPESLAGVATQAASREESLEALSSLVRRALRPAEGRAAAHGKTDPHAGLETLDGEHWHSRSSPFWHAYRRVESLFGGKHVTVPV